MRTHNFFSVNRKKLLQTLPLLGMLGLSILFADAQIPTFDYGERTYDCHPPLPITITPTNVTGISSEPKNVVFFAGMPHNYGYSSPSLNEGLRYKANFDANEGMAIDSKGNIFVADRYRIRKITPSGTVSTYAGSATESGDIDGISTLARFGFVKDVAIDASDNLYVTDQSNRKIKKIDPNQVVTTLCGGGAVPNDIFAPMNLDQAYFDDVSNLDIDENGIIYVTNVGAHILHKIDIQNKLVTVFAGSDYSGYPYCLDGSLLTARFFGMSGLAVSRDGSVIYVSDDETNCIRKIANGQVTTYAGANAYTENPVDMVNSDDPTLARFNKPGALELDNEGNLYVADYANKRVRKITPQQHVTTFLGSGNESYVGGYGESADFSSPKGLVFDKEGNLYISVLEGSILQSGFGFYFYDEILDPDLQIDYVLPEGFVLNTRTGVVTGTFTAPLISNNQVSMQMRARNEFGVRTYPFYTSGFRIFYNPIPQLIKFKPIPHQPLMSGMVALDAITTTGFTNIDFSSVGSSLTINPTTGPGSTVTFSGTGTAIIKADFPTMSGYVNAPTASRVLTFGVEPPILNSSSYTITPGSTTTLVNTGGSLPTSVPYIQNFVGNAAISNGFNAGYGSSTPLPASLYKPNGVDVDAYGNVYIADTENNKIRKYNVNAYSSYGAGYVSTYAGGGTTQYGAADGEGENALFHTPTDVAVDASGIVYVADNQNNTIRKITPVAGRVDIGTVTTFAGSGAPGNADGLGTAAEFNKPYGIDVDQDYNVYVVEQGNGTVRKIDWLGRVTTLISGLNSPRGIAVGNDGKIYVANTQGDDVRVYSPSGALLRTIGTTGVTGFQDGNETVAKFAKPSGIEVDQFGNIYVSDATASRIRKITPDGLVYTIAGNGGTPTPSETTTLLAPSFSDALGLALDAYGNLFVADTGNSLIRKFTTLGYSFYPPLPAGVTFGPNAQPNPTIDATYYTGPETTHTVIATNLGGSSSIKNSQDIPNEAFDNLKGTVKYGDVITLSANASSNLPITYSLETLLTDGITPSQDILSINGNVVTLTGIGKTRIKASQAGDFNYNAAPNKYFEFEVSKKSITITPKTDTKIYDGTKTSDENPVLGSDALVTGDRITTQASQEFEQESVSATGIKLKLSTPLGIVIKNSNDVEVTNYYTFVPSTTDITGSITKRPLKVTAVTDTKTYDGTTTASEGKVPTVEPTATGSGLAPNHVVKTPATQVFASKDVPVAPATNVNITCSDLAIKDANKVDVTANYTITYEPYANGVINKRVIEITANDNSKTYGDTDPAFSATVTSNIKPVDNETPTGTLVRETGDNVKFDANNNITYYAINQGTYTYGSNYSESSFISGKFTINKRSTTISTVTDTKKYKADDASSDEAPVGSNLLATDVVTSGQYFNSSAIGSNIPMKLNTPVVIKDKTTKIVKTSNYNITSTIENATGEITAKNVPVITFDPLTITGKRYGDATFDIVASSTVNGQASTAPTLTSSDDNIATVTDNKTITIKGVGDVTITATLAETTDNAAATKTLPFSIGTKELTLKDLSVSARNYDGTRNATITHSGFNETLVGTDVVTLHEGTATFEQKDVKTNMKVRHTGYSLDGTDEAKYSLIIPDILYGNINALPITIQAKNASKYYGQEDPAFEAIIATDSPNQPVAGDTPTGRLTRELGNDVKFDAQNNVTYYKIIRDENAKYSYGSNYDETFNFGQFTIKKRPITVKTVTATKKFNPNFPNDLSTTVVPVVSAVDPSLGLVSNEALTSGQHFASAAISTEPIHLILDEIVIKDKTSLTNKTINYEVTKDETATGNITDKDIQTVTITNPITGASTYGDSQFTLTVNSSSGLTPTFVSSDTKVATVDANGTITIVGAGTVTITVSVPGNDTYAPQSEPITITVNKKELTLLNLAVPDGGKTYDGTTSVTFTHGDLNGIVNSDVITLKEGTVAFEDKDAANNKKIVFTGYELVGDKKANYELNLSLTANIKRRNITITANDTTKTYGSTDPVFTAKVTSETKPVTGEKASGSLTRATGETVGKYDILIGTYSYGTNYYITFISDKLTIEKRKITVTARPETKKFNGNDLCTKTPIFDKTTLAPGDVLFTEATQHFSGTTVRTWDIVPDPLIIKNALGQNATPNYDIDYRTAINGGKITNKEVQIITVTSNLPATITYGDGPYVATPTSSAVPTLTVFNYSSDNENIATIDNNGHITITGAGEVNLYITQPGDVNNIYESETYVIHLNILKKALTINAVSTDKLFDNTVSSNGTPTYSGLVSGDSFVGLKQEFESRKVGNGITLNIVEPVVIKKGDRDVTNCYEITKNTAIGNITPSTYQIPLTITKSPTIVSLTKEYDTTTKCDVLQDFTFDGKEEGDDVICTASAEYQSADVNTAGTQITIKYTLSGKDRDNYKEPASETKIGYITPKLLTILTDPKVPVKVKDYDGTDKAEAIAGTFSGRYDKDINDLTLDPTAKYSDKNAGPGKTIEVKYTLKGNASNNYKLPDGYKYVEPDAEIKRLLLKVKDTKVTVVKMYNANDKTANVTDPGTLTNLVTGESLTLIAFGFFADDQVGENKRIIVSYKLEGAGSVVGNYLPPVDSTIYNGEIMAPIVCNITSTALSACEGSALNLTYTSTGKPIQYQVKFNNSALTDIPYTTLGSNNTITIQLPENLKYGNYTGTLTLKNILDNESTPVDFTFKVNISDDLILTKYVNVVFVNNFDKEFTAYQWYKKASGATDFVKIDGATKQYYQDKEGLVGEYKVEITTNNNDKFFTCPKLLNMPLPASVKAYPNPVNRIQPVTVIMVGVSEKELEGANMTIFSSQGLAVYTTTKVEKQTSVPQLPAAGIYIGRVTTAEGNEYQFKIVVIE